MPKGYKKICDCPKCNMPRYIATELFDDPKQWLGNVVYTCNCHIQYYVYPYIQTGKKELLWPDMLETPNPGIAWLNPFLPANPQQITYTTNAGTAYTDGPYLQYPDKFDPENYQ